MISIIVPVYNVEKYIKNCLDSIINQTYKDLEIILVDDGSTDNSGVICDEYASTDNRIKVIHKENGGQSSARNLGIKSANGEFIGFVDSDDTIELEMFELLYNAIQGTDIAICGHNVVYDNCKKTNSNSEEKFLNEESLWEQIFGKLNNAVWNKLFKREYLENIKFDLNFAHGEDLLFNIMYLKKAKTGMLVDKPMYNYYKRGDSITTGKFTRRKLKEIESKDEALRLVSEIYPRMIPIAEKYCFRARMNISRKIYKIKEENDYKLEIDEYRNYIKNNYKKVKKILRFKEKLEVKVFLSSKFLYRLLVKFY